MKKWVALFSHTGSEIAKLAETFGVWPTDIFTDNNNVDEWNKNIPEELVTISNPDAIHNGLRFTKERTLVTLHGYMKIIPTDVCELHDIYNGHPGAINLYPDLKGKDPQERSWENRDKYEYIGSVIHKVTPGIDEGEIVGYVYTDNDCQSKEEMYNVLRDCSYESWLDFLRREIFNDGQEEDSGRDQTESL